MPAGGRIVRLKSTSRECSFELVVEVDSIGHKHDACVLDLLVESKAAGKHDHGDRFARALRLPDDAAQAPAVSLTLFHSGEDIFDRKKLLIAGDLFDAKVEQRKSTGKIKEAIGTAQRIE